MDIAALTSTSSLPQSLTTSEVLESAHLKSASMESTSPQSSLVDDKNIVNPSGSSIPKTKRKKQAKESNGSSNSKRVWQDNSFTRRLELEAYSAIMTAFRAQGELTWKKDSILQDLRALLKISDSRHSIEAKRSQHVISTAAPSIAPSATYSRSSRATTYDFGSSSESEEEPQNTSDDETSHPKKKQKIDKESYGYLTAHPLNVTKSTNENTNHTLITIPTKLIPQSQHPSSHHTTPKKEKKKKEAGDHEKKKKKAVPKSTEVSESGANLEEAFDDVLDVSTGALPPDVVEAKDDGDLERMKTAIEAHKKKVQLQLAELAK